VGEGARGLHFSLCLKPHKCSINVSEGIKISAEKLDGRDLEGFPPLLFPEPKRTWYLSKKKELLTPSPANFPPRSVTKNSSLKKCSLRVMN